MSYPLRGDGVTVSDFIGSTITINLPETAKKVPYIIIKLH